MTLLNETEPRWTFPIELYKRRLKWKGINSGQNGVRMIAGSRSAAFGQSTSNSAPVCIHMPPEPANRHYSVPLKHSWRYLITNWWITRRIESNNALATVGDLNGPIAGCSLFLSQSGHSWGFGLESRSGVDEIRAEQTHIKHQPPQTCTHIYTYSNRHAR